MEMSPAATATPAVHQNPPEDPDPTRANRRKACDLCFNKKIKCDMLKPDCSNCILYHAKCRTTIVKRKANPPKPRPATTSETQSGDTAALAARLAKVESQLQQVLKAANANNQNTSSITSSSNEDRNTVDSNSSHAEDAQVQTKPWVFDPVDPCFYTGPEIPDLRLPPLQVILPIIEHYFANFNSIIPIFSKPVFMRLLDGWDSYPAGKNRAVWAAIQIVIAIGLRTPKPGAIDSGFDYKPMAHRCLMNAQSAVSDLVTRSEDLLGIQVLIGIVILFQDSKDPTPASVIIGSAVRLAHRLHLQSRDSMFCFSEEEVEQRSRVFWITYTLEKDICLRAKTPSVQLDADIDLPLPPHVSPDGSGMIFTQDGRTQFNYHRTRLELAHIQGRVFDLLYSNRAMRVKGKERQERVSRLQSMLDKWYDRIPSAFRLENVALTVAVGEVTHMTKMYYAFLLAEVMTHGIYSRDADWVKRISAVSRIAIRDMAVNENRNRAATCAEDQHAPLPDGWVKCVEVSRGCMKLFQYSTPTEALIWQCSCAHFSALIVVLSHMLLYPSHSLVSVDQQHSYNAVKLLDEVMKLAQDENFDKLRDIVLELYDKANAAVIAVENLHGFDAGDVFQQFAATDTLFSDAQTVDFLPFDVDSMPMDFMSSGVDGPFEGLETDSGPGMDAGLNYGQLTELPIFMSSNWD